MLYIMVNCPSVVTVPPPGLMRSIRVNEGLDLVISVHGV